MNVVYWISSGLLKMKKSGAEATKIINLAWNETAISYETVRKKLARFR